jgi:hypothetical protein
MAAITRLSNPQIGEEQIKLLNVFRTPVCINMKARLQIKEEVRPYADEVSIDTLGNALQPGGSESTG